VQVFATQNWSKKKKETANFLQNFTFRIDHIAVL